MKKLIFIYAVTFVCNMAAIIISINTLHRQKKFPVIIVPGGKGVVEKIKYVSNEELLDMRFKLYDDSCKYYFKLFDKEKNCLSDKAFWCNFQALRCMDSMSSIVDQQFWPQDYLKRKARGEVK